MPACGEAEAGDERGDAAMIELKRAYEEPAPSDGRRILVERLWPRGLSKQKAALDLWLKEAAPSAELRRWFAHNISRWPEFGNATATSYAAVLTSWPCSDG